MKINREQFEIEMESGVYYYAAELVTPKAEDGRRLNYDILAVFREDEIEERIDYEMHLVDYIYGVDWMPLEEVWEHFIRMAEEDWKVYQKKREEN